MNLESDDGSKKKEQLPLILGWGNISVMSYLLINNDTD
jgi:hypothetical protein